MASAWGNSWGSAWGNSWGTIGPVVVVTLRDAIKTLLTGDAAFAASGANVYIENEVILDIGVCPAVFVYITSRDAPEGEQRLTMRSRVDFLIDIRLLCVDFHLEDSALARKFATDLAALAEDAMMSDRTIGGKVLGSWPEGGRIVDLETSPLLSAVEVNIVAHDTALT